MNEDLSPNQTGRRIAAREKLAARRRRVRAIRRRVAGMSLATILAASGAVLVQLVTGHDPALGRTARTTVAVTSSSGRRSTTGRTSRERDRTATTATRHERSTGHGQSDSKSSSSAGSGAARSSRAKSRTSSTAAASPSAVTTSAS